MQHPNPDVTWKRRSLRSWRQSQRPEREQNKLWSACLPAKHGTSSWQALLINAAYNRSAEEYTAGQYTRQTKDFYRILNTFDNDHTPYNQDLTLLEKFIKQIESKDTTFILARHPLDRLYSAWGDKFREKKNQRNINMVAPYVKRIRSMEEEFTDFKPPGYYVSFQDFIKWYVRAMKKRVYDVKSINYIDNKNPEFSQWFFNHHWISQISECLPCSIKLDYIVKTETATEDSRFILNRIYPNAVTKIPAKYDLHVTLVGASSKEEINSSLDKIPFADRFRASSHKYEAQWLNSS